MRWDAGRYNEIQFFDAREPKDRGGFRTILVNASHPPFVNFCPAPGHGIGFNDFKVIEIYELMESIARQSKDQANAIEEVNSAVRQMDEMTQHNAALVEETNASIERTEEQAVELDRIVEIFRTGTADGRVTPFRRAGRAA